MTQTLSEESLSIKRPEKASVCVSGKERILRLVFPVHKYSISMRGFTFWSQSQTVAKKKKKETITKTDICGERCDLSSSHIDFGYAQRRTLVLLPVQCSNVVLRCWGTGSWRPAHTAPVQHFILPSSPLPALGITFTISHFPHPGH